MVLLKIILLNFDIIMKEIIISLSGGHFQGKGMEMVKNLSALLGKNRFVLRRLRSAKSPERHLINIG